MTKTGENFKTESVVAVEIGAAARRFGKAQTDALAVKVNKRAVALVEIVETDGFLRKQKTIEIKRERVGALAQQTGVLRRFFLSFRFVRQPVADAFPQRGDVADGAEIRNVFQACFLVGIGAAFGDDQRVADGKHLVKPRGFQKRAFVIMQIQHETGAAQLFVKRFTEDLAHDANAKLFGQFV